MIVHLMNKDTVCWISYITRTTGIHSQIQLEILLQHLVWCWLAAGQSLNAGIAQTTTGNKGLGPGRNMWVEPHLSLTGPNGSLVIILTKELSAEDHQKHSVGQNVVNYMSYLTDNDGDDSKKQVSRCMMNKRTRRMEKTHKKTRLLSLGIQFMRRSPRQNLWKRWSSTKCYMLRREVGSLISKGDRPQNPGATCWEEKEFFMMIFFHKDNKLTNKAAKWIFLYYFQNPFIVLLDWVINKERHVIWIF